MKSLTLVRHAKSSWNDAGVSDRERPLNARGERDAPEMGRRIVKHGIRPSLIITSPATRARATAKVIAQEMGYPIEFLQAEKALYLASLNTLIKTVAAQDNGFNSMIVVGHNPGMTDFANFLIPGLTNNLSTAGVVAVEIDQNNWSIDTESKVKLLTYDYPKLSETAAD